MKKCGWSFAVANAKKNVKQAANQILLSSGGSGVMTEIEEILNSASSKTKTE